MTFPSGFQRWAHLWADAQASCDPLASLDVPRRSPATHRKGFVPPIHGIFGRLEGFYPVVNFHITMENRHF